MSLSVNAVEYERRRFVVHVTYQGVFIGEIPISRERQESEHLEVIFE